MTGSTISVSTVATSRPPLKAIASGLQNTDPMRGIMPKIAARAVSMIGRKRSVAELIIASRGFWPSALWISIWSNTVSYTHLRKVQITARKREIYLEQHGYHRCKRCGMHMESKKEICPTCEYELHRAHIKDIKAVIRKYPYFKYSDCQQFIQCTFPDFAEAMRESIYFYLDKIYKGSINRRHMYMVAMLITHKKPDELTDQHVINLCNKYRSKFLAEEEQRKIDSLNGTLEK